MSNQPPASIEFINGPFDGHVEILRQDVEKLPNSIVCYVSENVFRILDGKSRLPQSTFTSVAIYQRRPRSKRTVYLFAGAVAPSAMKLQPVLGTSESNQGEAGED